MSEAGKNDKQWNQNLPFQVYNPDQAEQDVDKQKIGIGKAEECRESDNIGIDMNRKIWQCQGKREKDIDTKKYFVKCFLQSLRDFLLMYLNSFKNGN